jgi:hypothetical protein
VVQLVMRYMIAIGLCEVRVGLIRAAMDTIAELHMCL